MTRAQPQNQIKLAEYTLCIQAACVPQDTCVGLGSMLGKWVFFSWGHLFLDPYNKDPTANDLWEILHFLLAL